MDSDQVLRSAGATADEADVGVDVAADVAVVGYGPTGMAMTALLAQYGYRVVALERYPGLYSLPRAAIFDDETMRTLDKIGIAEQMLPKLHVQRNYEWVNSAGEVLIDHSFAERGRSGWAEWYMMYQPELEDALDAACRSNPQVTVLHGAKVVDLRQDDRDGVTLHVEGASGTSTVRSRYVIACDGGNSTVRQHLGVGQFDYGFSEPWLVCDFRLRRDVGLPTARQVGDPRHPVSIISLGPRHHRFSFMLDSEEDFATAGEPASVWQRVARFLHPDDADLIRAATYTFRSMVAASWRVGRVILAGDAAHQMPPFLGQGMCSGIRDAQNLAFKFDLLLRGRRGDDVLDTYQQEREPHVRAVVEKGIELGRLQTVRDPAAAAERDRRLLAARAAGNDSGAMRFPDLAAAGGMLAEVSGAGRGELFVQGDVRDGDADVDAGRRFDDVVGRGFVLLTTPDACGALRRDGSAERLREAGVLLVAVTDRPENTVPGSLVPSSIAVGAEPVDPVVFDVDGTYCRWLDAHEALAVAVRPDFYVYGTAGDLPAARALVDALLTDLGAPAVPLSAQPAAASVA